MWNQVYDPFANQVLSTLTAAIPVVMLLVLLASGKVKAHLAALAALTAAILVAVVVFTMPAGLAGRATLLGIATGFFPIGWIVLNVIFLYRLTVEKGNFATLQQAIGGITADRRLQLLLIAFAFGAFFEGASGFGTVRRGKAFLHDHRTPRSCIYSACLRQSSARQHQFAVEGAQNLPAFGRRARA